MCVCVCSVLLRTTHPGPERKITQKRYCVPKNKEMKSDALRHRFDSHACFTRRLELESIYDLTEAAMFLSCYSCKVT